MSNKSHPGSTNSNWRGGKISHPLYWIHADMVARCSRATHPRFASYGGRGITVCDRWTGRQGFWNFVADIGPRPEGTTPSGRPAFTLDRVNNDRGYSPDNCRWATYSQQAKNRRPEAYAGSVRDDVTGRFLTKEAC